MPVRKMPSLIKVEILSLKVKGEEQGPHMEAYRVDCCLIVELGVDVLDGAEGVDLDAFAHFKRALASLRLNDISH
jgi:hypothetical protein